MSQFTEAAKPGWINFLACGNEVLPCSRLVVKLRQATCSRNSEQEDFNDGHVQEDGGESEQEDKDGGHHEDQEIEESGSELDDSELDKLYEQMSDDIVAEEEMINDEESNVPRTPEVPANSFDNTVLFDRSAGKKRALNILEQSGSETDNDGSTFIEYDNQEKKKRDEEIPPYMQLRLNNIAARDAAMKAAEEAGLF